ncbi:MAG: hypothetical protein H0T08_06650 [Acidobacteria bacterium]|jgi:hypothetical protein|nr:hypothetical protein [Acidobacteriota bacterium]
MANEPNTPNTPNKDTAKTSGGMSNTPGTSTGAPNNIASTGQKSAAGDSFSSTAQGTQANKPPTTNASNESVDKAASQVGEVLRGNTGAAKDAAMDVLSQAKDTTGKVASHALGQVQEKATSQIDKQKTNLAQGLGSVAESIRQMGDGLKNSGEQTGVGKFTAQYGNSLANQVEQLSSYLDRKEVGELVRDVETFARRNPALFIGGAFALGLLGARFLKSSSPNQALIPSSNRRNMYNSDFGSSQENSVRTTTAPQKTSLSGVPEANKTSDIAADSLRKTDQKAGGGGTDNKTEGSNQNTRTL